MPSIVPNPLIDLTTLAAAQNFLTNADVDLPDDVFLQSIITAVSAQMQSYASRNLISQTYTTRFSGSGSRRMCMPNAPITAVSAVNVDGYDVQASTSSGMPGFVFDGRSVMLVGDGSFTRAFLNVSITYTAGYTTVPYDIEAACWEGISAVLQWMQRDPTIRHSVLGPINETVTPMSLPEGGLHTICLTPNVTAVLKQIRRVVPT